MSIPGSTRQDWWEDSDPSSLRSGSDVVVETIRGPRLGRVIRDGSALPDTAVPGEVGRETARGVLRTSRTGPIVWSVEIDVTISAGESMGTAGEIVVTTSISGVIRGFISPGHDVAAGFKIGDIAPRGMRAACFEISNKARAVGGGVLKVVLTWFDRMSA